ncbi:Stk1 family PASTA domain-containing Ser/Thr kinase [Buchananella felis]|uniref:Stk1 family PASTA domain-containing Ser/Thr kinase n=1 Tax=Buchananella felis TaxID=3231492 RepID=UPI00352830EA
MTQLPKLLGNRYEIGHLIGRGGMADVYVGFDSRLKRTVAIKLLRSDLARDPMFQTRFRREAQSAGRLNHPAIVAVHDTGEEDMMAADGTVGPIPYIVMEYVEGHTVRELLSEGDPVPIPEAVEIVAGILSALEYSHREGIVHRDIKPGNIMLTTAGQVKVMDFGIARAMEDSQSSMTQTHGVVGTAQYLSPEQARGEVVDSRSDLYSTGCVLYELLTGRPPFSGDTAVSVAYQHVQELPKPPSSLAADIPGDLDRVVLKALAKNRDHRYRDASEMRADLLKAERGQPVLAPAVSHWATAPNPAAANTVALAAATALTPAVPAPAPPAPPVLSDSAQSSSMHGAPEDVSRRREAALREQKRKKRLLWTWIAVALAVLVVGVGAFAILNGKEAEPTTVAVPELAGLDQGQVQQVLLEAGLKFELGPETLSADVERGKFVSADPAVGSQVAPGSVVKVSFSGGPQTFALPDLRNRTLQQARDELAALGLVVGALTSEDSGKHEQDAVIRTNPEPGTPVKAGDKVDVVYSTGLVAIQDFTNKMLVDAEQFFTDNGITASITYEESDLTPGTVLQQNPATGKVGRGSRVNLLVARERSTPTPQPTPTPPPASTQAPEPGTPSEDPSASAEPTGSGG